MLKDDEPRYVFHADRLIRNYRDLRHEFESRYKNVSIAYSYKTNYLRQICECLSSLGAMSEVVSPEELWYARKLGAEDKNIVYDGVICDTEEKIRVACNGGQVNVDNLDELCDIKEKAIQDGVRVPIGLRVNFEIEDGDSKYFHNSRFGFDIYGSDFGMALRTIRKCGYLELKGFQCHISGARPAHCWKSRAEKMVGLAKQFGAEYINLGGGMYGRLDDRYSKYFPSYCSYGDYAREVCGVLKSEYPEEDMKLILEPGTALVGDVLDLEGTVTSIKEANFRTYVTTNISSLFVNDATKPLPFEVIHTRADGLIQSVDDATIVGNTCIEPDVLAKSFSGFIDVGDKIRFSDIGAYSLELPSHFITGRPMVVDPSGNILARRESPEQIFARYLL